MKRALLGAGIGVGVFLLSWSSLSAQSPAWPLQVPSGYAIRSDTLSGSVFYLQVWDGTVYRALETFTSAATPTLALTGLTYANFGLTAGSSGYGVRDNAGIIEIKNSGGAWGTFLFGDGTVSLPGIAFSADPDTGLYRIGANNVGAAANGALVWQWNTTGLGVGVAAPSSLFHTATNTTGAGLSLFEQASADADAYDLTFRKARGTVASPTVITTADELGVINFNGYSGAAGYVTGAAIKALSAGTIATTRVPGFLSFWTGTDAAPTVLTERMRIDQAGNVGIGTTSPAALLDVTKTALATTSTDGVGIINTTAATGVATVQISPRLRFRGTAWDTAASQTVDFFLENLPATAATPTGTFKLGYSLNGAAATYPMTVSSAGVLTVMSALTTAGANTQSSAIKQATTTVTCNSGTATCTATNLIPAGSLVFGVDTRVTTILAGVGLTTWKAGDGTTTNAFANAAALAAGTTTDLTTHVSTWKPTLYTAATNVVLTANAGQFNSGVVRITVHYLTIVAAAS